MSPAAASARSQRRLGLARMLAPLLAAVFCLPAEGQRREPRRLFPVEGDRGGTGFIDREGRVVIPPEGVDFGEVVRAGRYRLPRPPDWMADAEERGRQKYRARVRVGEFSEGLARFSINTRPGSRALFLAYGYVDETGKVVIPPVFRGASAGDFHDGRALFNGDDGLRGYIDRTGAVRVPAVYRLTWRFSEGLAAASLDGRSYGYIDPDGNVAIPFRFLGAAHFSEGLAQVGLGEDQTGYIDRTGRVLFRLRAGDHGGEFRDGLALLRVGGIDGKRGFIDRAGRVVIPAEYDDARDFSEGKALVKRGDSWGFIDRAGRVVIPLNYAYGSSFSEGLAAVTTARARGEAGWGYIDHEGRVRIPLTLDYAEPFSGGLAAIDRTVDGVPRATDAYIDPHGRVVWEKKR